MAQLNLCFQVAFLAVLLPLTSGACVDFYLGMGSGTIPDSKINASSIQSASTPATNGRLNYTLGSSWCAGTSDKNPYLQIDLQKLHIICAVSTQGNSQADQWVKTYTLQLSTDGITWTNYSELGGQAKVLEGNKDRNSNVKHVLYGVLTRYLRFLPQTHHGEVCMRTEVFGVQQKPTCDSQAIGLASGGTIPDDSFSASSTFAPRYAAKYGRLKGKKAWEPKTNTDPDDYLQIDLLYEYVICAVATQGNPPKQSSAQEWTTEYKLRFSFNGTTFFPYKENKNDKAFQGNSGKTDTVKNSLKEFASAKYIRFLPTKYNRFKALRVEAYGILFTKVPSQPPTAFKLTATSSTSIAASWQLPPVHARHATITGFKLFYTEKGSGVSITTVTISGESTFSRNVTGLDKYTEYEFQVLAFSSDGDGPKSSVEVERTMEDAPSKAPSNFKVSAVTSTIIAASWQLPPADSRNGIIIGFKLFYKKRGSSGQATTLTINNGAALSKDVTGLDIYTEYEFEVLAFTSVGGGPKSSPLVVVRTMKDGCVEFNLGMEDGRILDTGINASSSSTPAKNGRLNYVSGSSWCARTGDSKPYLQIDLQTLHIICAVSTQGNSRADQWVKTYTLQLSIDGTTWTNYTELGGQAKVLIGNDDKNSEVKHVVYGVLTRYLRFRPETHQGGVCMRTEVFGVKQKPTCDSQAIGLASSGRIPDNSFSARSIFAPRYAAKYGRLNGEKAWEPKTNTDPDDYLQIDLLYEYVICAVATQGNPPSQSPAQEWTTEYKLRFSFSDNTFFPYEENKIDKAFPGNSGKSDTVKNSLKEFASAKFIRFLPTKYNKFKVLRVEAYGILFTKAPSVGPEPLSLSTVNKTTFNISWEPLPREKSHGKVILYEVKAIFVRKGNLRKRSVINSPSVNTSVTYVVLSDLELCANYNVSVRAYTAEGPGPYGKPLELETSRPDAPEEFKVTDSGTNQITVAWKQYDKKETIVYAVKYTGTKSYNKTFRDAEKTIKAIKATTQKVEGLIPGTTYEFRVHGNSVCGDSASRVISEMTDMMAPEAPHPHNITDVEVSQTAVDIYLWPVEQKYGPVSAYQVIVLKVADGVKELPDNYDSKLKAVSDAKKENVNFYIATEIENEPILSKPQKFTVGDGNKFKEFVNEELEKGENYIVYERALTRAEKEELKGYASIVAKISITSTTTEGEKKEKSSGSNAAAVAVPVVLLLFLIPAVVIAVFLYRRRRQSRSKSAGERSVQLDDIKDDSQDPTSSTSNVVYQNVGDIRRTIHGAEKQPDSEEKEAIYSEADDGKPKPIPVAEFPKYFKRKSENGAIVLREEFKYLPGGMQFAWEIAESNRGKNRYGNIVSYDHSRVLLEEIEGDKNSSYINASYIPTYDEVTMTYIATQGPTSTTIADFWRMVWQENSFAIVMLTNLVELGKGKCDQYWPDDTSKFGAITVTLHKTETFADYVIRSLIVTKDSEKRTVQQFHYVTWPDKGVPQHSTALLGFRQKIHARHQATGGPLVVHCSAGVGRTGTYIAIDAMLESAEKIKTVFIQNYVQVMRRSRPHMVQKDDQYVFLHQAVMEALVCGNTEIIPQDLRIATNKLAKVHKPSKKTGYERELKRLELVTDAHASQEVATNAFMAANVVKNSFPNIVPLDNARVHLQVSSQEKSYINASYVDDYTQRNAYILTQAPLDCTIIDFWLMISQYDIGTVVMLNNLEEGKQSYPQYWPSEGSAKYGEVTVQLLSQETSNNITTRGFSVENAAPPKKTSTLQHIQYNGWANENSCPDPQDILDLMTTVQQSQQQSGNRVIVFQCSDGTGRSGCVATIMSVIERVKTEQTVDVFQTVKLVRAKRPGAVNTLELYMFCYKTVLAYLDSFSTYSNFAEC